ncbi:hypothetical protein [Bifidobacterium crudilactis]|jgi:hypothetical protein|uniref:hypothetical protein n=1 Tax=Bifidobacterium crudilactis TaxID=327277 RepID=UPI0023525CAD|nr:hypothetical protein [Bifidobacterium crudilactis]MCI1868706.1 hypothetical protein [Bifidobacterium crudilactis]
MAENNDKIHLMLWKNELGILGRSNYALVSHGLEILRSYRTVDEELAVYPMLSCLALGFEQSCKAVLSLIDKDVSGHWPDVSELKRYGHSLSNLKDRTLEAIHERMSIKKHYMWLDYIYELVSSDISIKPFIDILSDFGSGGRYYSLDLLAGSIHGTDRQGAWPSWENTVENFIQTDPVLKKAFEDIIKSNKLEFEELNLSAHTEIAFRLQRFYDLLIEAGIHDLLGDDGLIWYSYAQGQDKGLSKRMDLYKRQAEKNLPERFHI